MTKAEQSLVSDLDSACLRYLEIRIEFYKMAAKGEDISEVDSRRTKAHDALIACFNSVLRMLKDKPKDMVESSVNRVAIGKWGMLRALALLNGSKFAGNL